MKERQTKDNKINNNNNNNIIIQVTLFDVNGKYKPISTLIEVESIEEYRKNSSEYKRKAIQKICNKKYLTGKELIKLGYTQIKVRNYTLWKEIEERKMRG